MLRYYLSAYEKLTRVLMQIKDNRQSAPYDSAGNSCEQTNVGVMQNAVNTEPTDGCGKGGDFQH